MLKEIAVDALFKVKIIDYTYDGLGIGKIDEAVLDGEVKTNYPLFVFGALVGEEVLVKITKFTSNYGAAEIERWYGDLSKDRIKPLCNHYYECGGCDLMHFNYDAACKFKEAAVKNDLKRIGGLDVNLLPIIKADDPYFYRNKVIVPVGLDKNKAIAGFYQRKTHQIIPLDYCYIQNETSTEIIKFTKNILNELGVKAFSESTNSGNLKHIMIRHNSTDDEYQVVIVVKEDIDDLIKDGIIKKINQRYPQVKSIMLNINPKNNNTVMSSDYKVIYGDSFITDTLLGFKFKISPASFYQVNHDQCERLYKCAIDFAGIDRDDVIIDAYSGIGTIGIIAAKSCKYVYSVEIVEDAIKCGINNAKLNNIDNIEFISGKSENIIPDLLKKKLVPNVIIVDPPRKGLDNKLINSIIENKIAKIIYISCDPGTLSRDLKVLSDYYSVSFVQCVDMFPLTHHVETIVCLSKNRRF